MRQDQSTFQAKIQELRRIVVPKGVCEALNLKKGDPVIIEIKKAQK